MRSTAGKRLDSAGTFQSLALALMLVSDLGAISREAAHVGDTVGVERHPVAGSILQSLDVLDLLP